MKSEIYRSRTVRICITAILILCTQLAFAQNKKGDVLLNAGVSLMPGINFIADIGLSPKASFGIGYTHTWFSQEYIRDNFALRMLYHFNNENDWDFYIGGRFGMSKWTNNGSQNTNPYFFFSDRDLGKQYPSMQFVFGARYLINPCFGLNAEAALGFPYFGSAGFCININNSVKALSRKKDPAVPEPASPN